MLQKPEAIEGFQTLSDRKAVVLDIIIDENAYPRIN